MIDSSVSSDPQVTLEEGGNYVGKTIRCQECPGENLKGMNCARTLIEDVDLQGCDLENSDFSGAVMYRVDLTRTNLQGVNFSNARLVQCKVDEHVQEQIEGQAVEFSPYQTLPEVLWSGITSLIGMTGY